jgi:hypothetical protein
MTTTDLLKRSVATAIKLPAAIAWDCLSLGNMGEGASTSKVLREHQQRKELDEVLDLARRLRANDEMRDGER